MIVIIPSFFRAIINDMTQILTLQVGMYEREAVQTGYQITQLRLDEIVE
jgi:hypothetical protein